MNLHTLKPAQGATHKKIRLGRGEASGKGGTATKGNKGQKSRAGYKYKWSHEGGQMPLQRRLPKRGFKNPFRVEYRTFNLGQIDELVKKYGFTDFSLANLVAYRLAHKDDKVKILSDGKMEQKVTIEAHAVSAKARTILEEKGCTIHIIK